MEIKMNEHSLRAVVVYDIKTKLDLGNLANADRYLKEFAASANFPSGVSIEQVQAEVSLIDRRGATGPINEIVFRGTRGPNSNPALRYDGLDNYNRKRLQIKESQEAKKRSMPLQDFRNALDAGKLEITLDDLK
jgi:hypothetical protein